MLRIFLKVRPARLRSWRGSGYAKAVSSASHQVVAASFLLAVCGCTANYENTTKGGQAASSTAVEAGVRPSSAGDGGSQAQPAQGGAGGVPVLPSAGGNAGAAGGPSGLGGTDSGAADAGGPRCPAAVGPVQTLLSPQLTEANVNELQPYVLLTNESDAPVPLEELEVRYYFTSESAGTPVFKCHFSSNGAGSGDLCQKPSALKFERVALELPVQGMATHYMRVYWSTSSPLPGQGEYELRFGYYELLNNKPGNRLPLTQSNDYSFQANNSGTQPNATSYTETTRVNVYRNGELVWGEEPCEL